MIPQVVAFVLVNLVGYYVVYQMGKRATRSELKWDLYKLEEKLSLLSFETKVQYEEIRLLQKQLENK